MSGPGPARRISSRCGGAALLEQADQVIYAGSLVYPALLLRCKEDCRILNSAEMTLEQVLEAIQSAEAEGKTTVRLHTGDLSLYGAIREQMERLEALSIPCDVTPGLLLRGAARKALDRG